MMPAWQIERLRQVNTLHSTAVLASQAEASDISLTINLVDPDDWRVPVPPYFIPHLGLIAFSRPMLGLVQS